MHMGLDVGMMINKWLHNFHALIANLNSQFNLTCFTVFCPKEPLYSVSQRPEMDSSLGT